MSVVLPRVLLYCEHQLIFPQLLGNAWIHSCGGRCGLVACRIFRSCKRCTIGRNAELLAVFPLQGSSLTVLLYLSPADSPDRLAFADLLLLMPYYLHLPQARRHYHLVSSAVASVNDALPAAASTVAELRRLPNLLLTTRCSIPSE